MREGDSDVVYDGVAGAEEWQTNRVQRYAITFARLCQG